jgi:thiol-disulfide isomerase/thioredoxin
MTTKQYFIFFITIILGITFSCKSKKEDLKTKLSEIVENYDTPPNITEGLSIGNKAPELASNNPNDSMISLSSLKGYYVLIDFWASWCGPCRYENPNVVRAYKKYSKAKFAKGKGFKVFNVSLDNNKAPWKSAIIKDSLNWPYHISDLKGWGTALGAKYQVNSIPTNWLIDSRGIIIAKGLRGPALEAEIDKYLDNTLIETPSPNKKNKK